MTGASMMTPASNCSCMARHLRSRPARRSDRTTWPSGGLRLEDVDQDGIADRQRGLALTVATEQLAVADDAFASAPMSTRISSLSMRTTWPSSDVTVLNSDVRVLLVRAAPPSSSAPGRAGERRRVPRPRPRRPGASAVSSALEAAGGWRRRHRVDVDHRIRVGHDRIRVGHPDLRRPRRLRVGDGLHVGHDGLGLGYERFGCVGCLVVSAGGGLVGDGDRRDGVLGRLVGDGGDSLRLRRGPALLLFGQGSGLSWWSIRALRITNGPSGGSAVSENDRVVRGDRLGGSAPWCVDGLYVARALSVPLGAGRV